MAETVSYGSYTFPTPTPLVAEGSESIYVSGVADHFLSKIDIVGNITGTALSGLDIQKMLMISGMLSEFQTLSISNDTETKEFLHSKPVSISFSDSDLTTVLPYSISFEAYSSGTFSKFLGVTDPQDTWTFQESDGKISSATHSVSAKGVKTGSISPLVSARDFVTGRMTGFTNLSLFQTGDSGAFLISRTEDINKAANSYSLNEEYKFTTSEDGISDSGVVTTETSISYEKEGGLSVQVGGSIFGSIDSNLTGGLLTTGNFTAAQAQEVAVNAAVSSLSDYESGSYTFVNRGPTTYNYTVNTGENKIDFSFSFSDPDNVDQTGNVLHTRSASIAASKDKANLDIKVNGTFTYNAPFDIMGTGDPINSQRFIEVQREFSGVSTTTGFLKLAVEALKDFTGDATGWFVSGDYVNPVPNGSGITKTPAELSISYDIQFDNKYDLTSGELTGAQFNITDKTPIELYSTVPTLGGFSTQKTHERTLGEYSVAATCEGGSGQLLKLEQIVSGYITGIYDFAKSDAVDEQRISFNLSRYY